MSGIEIVLKDGKIQADNVRIEDSLTELIVHESETERTHIMKHAIQYYNVNEGE